MIGSVEEAKEYIKIITERLEELAAIAEEAGVPIHQGLFFAIAGVVTSPIEDQLEFKEMMIEFCKKMVKRVQERQEKQIKDIIPQNFN